jgi:hypothetical protein
MPDHMTFNSSRDTLLLQLFAIGDSVSELRAELRELGGALIEAEHKRLAGKLARIELEHARLVESLYKPPRHH